MDPLWLTLYELLQRAFNLNKPKSKWKVIYPQRARAKSSSTRKMRTIVIDPIGENKDDDPIHGPNPLAARALASELKISEGERFNKHFYALVIGALRGTIENGNNVDPDLMLGQIIRHYVKPRQLAKAELGALVEYVKAAAQSGAFEFDRYDDKFISLVAGFLPRPALPGVTNELNGGYG